MTSGKIYLEYMNQTEVQPDEYNAEVRVGNEAIEREKGIGEMETELKLE
jgi:hypothetical protein